MLEFLFGPANPTRSWPPRRAVALTFDLEESSLNSVRLGEPVNKLSFLGPVEDEKALAKWELSYPSLGLEIRFGEKSRCIVDYRIVENDPLAVQFRRFCGTVLIRGQGLPLDALTRERILREYGECYWLDCDDDEVILFYEVPGAEWQFEFDSASRIRCITTTCEPILAHEDQRIAYGVTAPWPPRRRA